MKNDFSKTSAVHLSKDADAACLSTHHADGVAKDGATGRRDCTMPNRPVTKARLVRVALPAGLRPVT